MLLHPAARYQPNVGHPLWVFTSLLSNTLPSVTLGLHTLVMGFSTNYWLEAATTCNTFYCNTIRVYRGNCIPFEEVTWVPCQPGWNLWFLCGIRPFSSSGEYGDLLRETCCINPRACGLVFICACLNECFVGLFVCRHICLRVPRHCGCTHSLHHWMLVCAFCVSAYLQICMWLMSLWTYACVSTTRSVCLKE